MHAEHNTCRGYPRADDRRQPNIRRRGGFVFPRESVWDIFDVARRLPENDPAGEDTFQRAEISTRILYSNIHFSITPMTVQQSE